MSIVALVPFANMEAANASLQSQGFGPDSFSVFAYAGPAPSHAAVSANGNAALTAAIKLVPGVVFNEDAGEPAARVAALFSAQGAQWGDRASALPSSGNATARTLYRYSDGTLWWVPQAFSRSTHSGAPAGYPSMIVPALSHAEVSGGALVVPSGLGWTPPVSVFRSAAGGYATSYDPTPFLIEGGAGVTTLYVDAQTGSDANPGTSASPKQSLAAASNMTRLTNLLIKARGTFTPGFTNNLQQGHDNLCVEAWGGAACNLTTNPAPPHVFVWTDQTGGVWSCSAPTPVYYGINVFNGTDVDTMTRYTPVASLAECQALPGSWYTQSSTTHYVHTLTGASPATGHTFYGTGSTGGGFNAATNAYDQRIGFYGVNFYGGSAAFNLNGETATYSKRVDFVNCNFKHASNFGALAVGSSATVILYNCTAGPSGFDGFGYTTNSGGAGIAPKVMEIGCVGRNNGHGLNIGANQGSTSHQGAKVVRVNGQYYDNEHDQIVETNAGTKSWNLGCTAGPGVTSPKSAFGAAPTATMWLDGCTAVGMTYDVFSDAGCTVYYKNMPAPSSPGGTGTVATY